MTRIESEGQTTYPIDVPGIWLLSTFAGRSRLRVIKSFTVAGTVKLVDTEY